MLILENAKYVSYSERLWSDRNALAVILGLWRKVQVAENGTRILRRGEKQVMKKPTIAGKVVVKTQDAHSIGNW